VELRRDPAGARPAGIGRSRQARAVTWPLTAAEVTHACHKDTVHVTAVLDDPLTVDVKLPLPPGLIFADVGLTETETPDETVIVEEADWVVSATLVATMVWLPPVAGAV
jgi:hypothetical protein